MTLSWNPNPEPDIAGYRVAWGTASGVYTQSADVGNSTSFEFRTQSHASTYYFIVWAYDTNGLYSPPSPEGRSDPLAPRAPSIVTGSAGAITVNGAALNGIVNPNGWPTNAYFEYGATTSYGQRTLPMNAGWGVDTLAIVNGTLSGLACDTVHYYRAVGTDGVTAVNGERSTFRTAPCLNRSLRRRRAPMASDFNGDGVADLSVFRPASHSWWVRGNAPVQWGQAGDKPVPGDYDGDRRADIAVFRPSTGVWLVRNQATVQWGRSGDIPVPGDYDGNGTTDVAVFRPSSGLWLVLDQPAVEWGQNGDIPVPGDYNGDGVTDIAVFRPSTATWLVRNVATIQWGSATDVPMPGDFDGDGTTDLAMLRPGNYTWWVRSRVPVQWGIAGDVPVADDFNGDGLVDIAVYRPSSNTWYIRNQPAPVVWGQATDIPLPGRQPGVVMSR